MTSQIELVYRAWRDKKCVSKSVIVCKLGKDTNNAPIYGLLQELTCTLNFICHILFFFYYFNEYLCM